MNLDIYPFFLHQAKNTFFFVKMLNYKIDFIRETNVDHGNAQHSNVDFFPDYINILKIN